MTNTPHLIKKICVTGANGYIGRRLLDELIKKGYDIRVLTRNSKTEFPKGVEVIIADLINANNPLTSFVANADVVINCAGEIHEESQMRPLHLDGTKALIRASFGETKNTDKKIHWVQLSSCGAYGPPKRAQQERIVTENYPTNPKNEYELTETIADELIMEAAEKGLITYAILRPSNVFGINMKDQSLPKLINLIKEGKFFFLGRPGTMTKFVHVVDMVRALIIVMEDSRAKGRIFNLSSDRTLEVLVKRVISLANITKPILRIPAPLIRFPLAIIATLLKNIMHVPRLDALVLRTQYPSDKIKTVLGYEFAKLMQNSVEDLIKN